MHMGRFSVAIAGVFAGAGAGAETNAAGSLVAIAIGISGPVAATMSSQ
jgi:hypothetical protein